jgi:hypothetical protein
MVLVFVLAAFCWTKSLLCNVAAFTGMLFYLESTLQLWGSEDSLQNSNQSVQFPCIRPNAFQSATSVWTMRTFRPDAHQCLEASNSSRMHLSGRNGKSSGRSSEFDTLFSVPMNPFGRRGYTIRMPFSVWHTLGFLPQDTVIGRWLKPSGRCVIPSGRCPP